MERDGWDWLLFGLSVLAAASAAIALWTWWSRLRRVPEVGFRWQRISDDWWAPDEELTLRRAVRRVARVVGRRPLMFPMPVWFHYLLGWCVERVMAVPLVSVAQVRMLAEGLAEPAPSCDPLPPELAPQTPFTEEQIHKGLPPPGPFRWRDIRCCHRSRSDRNRSHSKRVFFEMP